MTDREQRIEQIQEYLRFNYVGFPQSTLTGDVQWLLDQLAERDRRLETCNGAYVDVSQRLDWRTKDLAEANKLVGELAEAVHRTNDWSNPGSPEEVMVQEILNRPAVQEALKTRQSEPGLTISAEKC